MHFKLCFGRIATPITITIYITRNDYYCIAQNIFVMDVDRCIIHAGLWKTVAANLNLIFITIGAFKYPILTIIASPIVADFQYVVYKYFTQIINVTDILLQFFWGRILYSLD